MTQNTNTPTTNDNVGCLGILGWLLHWIIVIGGILLGVVLVGYVLLRFVGFANACMPPTDLGHVLNGDFTNNCAAAKTDTQKQPDVTQEVTQEAPNGALDAIKAQIAGLTAQLQTANASQLQSLRDQIAALQARLDGQQVPPPVVTQEAPQGDQGVQPQDGQISDGRSINWPAFKAMLASNNVVNPYTLRDWLDARPEKVDHSTGHWTVSAQASIVWTGWYDGDIPTSGVHFLLVDGKTGVFVVEQGIEVPDPAGEIPLNNWDGNAPFIAPQMDSTPVNVSASECADTNTISTIISTWKDINPDGVFANLDSYVGNRPTQRLMTNGAGHVSVTANEALIWTRQVGSVTSGATLILSSNGKGLFLANTTGTLEVQFAFSGVRLCTPYGAQTPQVQPTVPPTMGTEQSQQSQQSQQPQGGSRNTQCIPHNEFVQILVNNRTGSVFNEAGLYGSLESLARKYPDAAVLRESAPDGQVNLVTGKNGTNIILVYDGLQHTDGMYAIDTSSHHSLWLWATDQITPVADAFILFTICDPVNPERDFPWARVSG